MYNKFEGFFGEETVREIISKKVVSYPSTDFTKQSVLQNLAATVRFGLEGTTDPDVKTMNIDVDFVLPDQGRSILITLRLLERIREVILKFIPEILKIEVINIENDEERRIHISYLDYEIDLWLGMINLGDDSNLFIGQKSISIATYIKSDLDTMTDKIIQGLGDIEKFPEIILQAIESTLITE